MNRLVHSVSLAIVFMSLIGVAISHADAAGFLGEWARADGVAHARMAPCGDKLCMTNTRIQNSTNDEKVGDKVIITVRQRSEDNISAVAFDPQRNRSFTLKMKVDGDQMTMSACVAGGMFCKSMKWTRLH